MNRKLIVFTDLDGSLLDHCNYEWQAAKPALEKLGSRGFPLVFASSKTFAEIRKLRDETDNRHPAIIENGTAVAVPAGYFDKNPETNEEYEIQRFAKPYKEIVNVIHSLRDRYGYRFRGFSDMSVQEIRDITSLNQERAIAAKAREATEPIIWNDAQTRLDEFRVRLEQQDLTLTRGGRFHHVMSPVNKGRAVGWLLGQYREHDPDVEWISIGLGDSDNDIEMLQQVDYPVLVNNPHIRQPDLSELDNLTRSRLPGPQGWNESVLRLITKLV